MKACCIEYSMALLDPDADADFIVIKFLESRENKWRIREYARTRNTLLYELSSTRQNSVPIHWLPSFS